VTLIFKRGPDAHNNWVIGCLPTWEWEKNGGGYTDGRDFFCVHWQVNIPKSDLSANVDRGIIRLHVESPRYEVDPFLNEVKRELIAALHDSKLGQEALNNGYDYKMGIRTSIDQVRSNKSTEPLRVLIPESQLKKADEDNIAGVHAALGSIVDQLVRSLDNNLNRYFSE
jgi:hypothetical protein